MKVPSITAAMLLALGAAACGSAADARTTVSTTAAIDTPVIRRIWAGEDGRQQRPSRDGRYAAFVDRTYKRLVLRDLASGRTTTVKSIGSGTADQGSSMYDALPSRDGSSIAFGVSLDDPGITQEIRVIDAGGSRERALIAESMIESYLAPEDWSRDGRDLLLIRYVPTGNQLLLVSTADGRKRVLRSFEWRVPVKPTFSPDDRFIAYSLQATRQNAGSQIHILDLRTAGEAKIGPTADGLQFLGWGADGASVLYTTANEGLQTIWRLPVTNGKAAGAAQVIKRGLPAVSARGTTERGVMFTASDHDDRRILELATLDVENGVVTGAREVASHTGATLSFSNAWSADGNLLAYARMQATPPQLAIVVQSLRSGETQEIPVQRSIGMIWTLRWDASGRALLFSANSGNEQHWYRLPMSTGVPVRIDTTVVDSIRTSRDGRTQFIRSTRPDQRQTIIAVDLRTRRRDTVAVVEGAHAFSPDDSLLVAMLRDGGRRGMVLVETRGARAGMARRIPAPEPSGLAFRWTGDGKYVFFPANHGAGSRERAIAVLDVAKGETRLLNGYSREDLVYSQLGPDDRQLLVSIATYPRNGELWLIDEKAGTNGSK